MALTAEEACNVVRTRLSSGSEAEPGTRLKAQTIQDTGLWAVELFGPIVADAATDERPAVGAAFVVGPDGQLFVLSSNPAFHEYPLCIDLIDRLYRDRVADRVDAQMFVDRLQQVTEQRQALVRDLFRDVVAGSVRNRERHLP